jgi:DNA-binding NtrC family response regulator
LPGRTTASAAIRLHGPGAENLVLERGQLRIGKDPANDLVITSSFASAYHATLFWRAGAWHVRDLGSKNGTYLNHIRIVEAEVVPPARLKFGDVSFSLEDANDGPRAAHGLVGSSEVMKHLLNHLERFAKSPAPVLITGESGTGKELVARALHDQSSRAAKPYVAINCGALAANLIESELFGHVKGAFTGASERRLGAFASANGGTLFLDEIGELPLALQPQLLRALENQEIKAVGEDKAKKVDVRVIAATHRDLKQAVAAGQFRQDLYHRLSVLTLSVPPLRERHGDVVELAEHLLATMSPADHGVRLDPEALDALARHSFPGNVRELRNVLLRGLVLATDGVIHARDLGIDPTVAEALRGDPLPAKVERQLIIQTVHQVGGSRLAAARRLQMSRSTFYRKLEQYAITNDELDDEI